jgi:hypothetical protein
MIITSMTCSMPVKRRRLNGATITHHWQPVYMSTRSKQKGPDAPRQKAPEAYWTPVDKAALVSFLSDEGAVKGASYKPQVWIQAAAKMKNPPDRGVPKTAAACKGLAEQKSRTMGRGGGVTSVTPRRTLTDSEWDFSNRLNHYPHFTSFPFPISSRILSQLLIHNLPSLLPYLRIVTAASTMELLPSINT